MVDQVREALVGGALLRRHVRRVEVPCPERRPPPALQPRAKGGGTEHAEDVPAYALPILQHGGVFGHERQVGSGVDVADEQRVTVEVGAVFPAVSSLQTDAVQDGPIGGGSGPQLHTGQRTGRHALATK